MQLDPNYLRLSPLELDVLAVCCGHVRKLPYDKLQEFATKRLKDMHLIYFDMGDDQPSYWATPAGFTYLKAMTPREIAHG